MIKAVALLLVVFVLVAGAIGAVSRSFPSYTHRYRLTLIVEVDGVERSGSSVIEVKWRKQPKFGDAPPWMSSIKGQAAAVPVNSGVVLATLGGSHGVTANFLALRAFGHFPGRPTSFPPDEEGLAALSQFSGRAQLQAGNLPQLVWLRDVNDPKSAQPVRASDFANKIAPTVQFLGAWIETTDHPITTELGAMLPWLREMYDLQTKRGVLSWPGEYQLTSYALSMGVRP